MGITGYIGIDFGTSNSHFAYCNTSGELKPQTVRLGGKSSVATCVLWKLPAKGDGDVLGYGSLATEEWASASPEENQGKRLAFGFKPDILTSNQARRDAGAFLALACREMRTLGLPGVGVDEGMPVVVGVPAEIGDEQKRLTAEIARDAGFGDVTCIEEPLGALAFHLNTGDISPSDARGGVIVVDFGGGTLDVAHVDESGFLRKPWGEPALGGRLFDDLFFRWLIDQNPGLELSPNEAMFAWQHECRQLKENFSNRWRTEGPEMKGFKGKVDLGRGNAYLRDASVAEFRKRARHYRPTDVARGYFRALGGSWAAFADRGEVDLLGWVNETLVRGLGNEPAGVRFTKVMLTGGSSAWPFLRDEIVPEAFGIASDRVKERVRMSAEPETTIGSGLALYHVLKLHNDRKKSVLVEGLADLKTKLNGEVGTRLDRFASDLAGAIVAGLMPRVEEIFWNWYWNGGSLNGAERKVEAACIDFQPTVMAILETKRKDLERDLLALLRQHLQKWLEEHDIHKSVSDYIPADFRWDDHARAGKTTADKIAREMGEMAAGIAAMVATIGGVIIGAVKLKVLILFAIVHPIAANIAAAAAMIGIALVGEQLEQAVEERVKAYEFGDYSAWAMRRVLWESRFQEMLADGRKSVQSDLTAKVRETMEPVREKTIAKYEAILKLVIQDLNVLEEIRTASR